MNRSVELLTEVISEKRPDKPERWFEFSKTITVRNKKFLVVNNSVNLAIDDIDAKFVAKIVKHPYVMVTY